MSRRAFLELTEEDRLEITFHEKQCAYSFALEWSVHPFRVVVESLSLDAVSLGVSPALPAI